MTSFRVSRHNLSRRASAAQFGMVVGSMGGAQAQLLQAAQLSIWARTRVRSIAALESAIWEERTLVRAWCMRRTLFLLPAEELAMFVRGTTRRAAYALRWAEKRADEVPPIDRLLDDTVEALKKPLTRNGIARALASKGYPVGSKAGGGWGDQRMVASVTAGGISLSIGFVLHMLGAREVICSGPNLGSEATYVRADRWIPHWRDVDTQEAEDRLLVRYLEAFGPSTLSDFALWAGMYVRDAKVIWSRGSEKMTPVDVDGWKSWALRSDISELESARSEGLAPKLLPNFDSFLLGHKSHSNVVDESYRKKVYRPQGWVSPVILVDGRASGVWSFVRKPGLLEVRVEPFKVFSKEVRSQVEEEAEGLGRFLGSEVNISMGPGTHRRGSR